MILLILYNIYIYKTMCNSVPSYVPAVSFGGKKDISHPSNICLELCFPTNFLFIYIPFVLIKR